MKEVDISDLSKEELYELIARVHDLGALHLAVEEAESQIEWKDNRGNINKRNDLLQLQRDIQKVITDPKQIREKQIR